MGRHRQPEIRTRLLDGTTRFLLEHGLPAPALRAMAEALSTSPRMLIYHFETKDKLVNAALVEARRRQREFYGTALTHEPGRPYAETLAAAWQTMSGVDGQRYARLFSAVHNLPAGQGPWSEFPVLAVHDWLPTIEAGLRADGHPDPAAAATLIVAVARGLLLDLRSTGETDRTTPAFATLVAMLQLSSRT